MNPQVAISFPAGYVGQQAWARQLEALQSAVTHLGPKEVAWKLEIDGPRLSDALKERNQKVWHPLWTHVVKAMLVERHEDEIAADILRAILEADVVYTPFALTDDVPLTTEQENAEYQRELAKLGAVGKAAIERVKRKARR